MTGASVTNKGIYYEHGKEPPAEGPPKLHLLIESNEEFRVRQISHAFMDYADLLFHRSNKPLEKLRGCLLKHLPLHYKQKCVIRQLQWVAIVFSNRLLTFLSHSCLLHVACSFFFHVIMLNNYLQYSEQNCIKNMWSMLYKTGGSVNY